MKQSAKSMSRLGVLSAFFIVTGACGQGGPGSADGFSYRCHILHKTDACKALEVLARGGKLPSKIEDCLVEPGGEFDDEKRPASLSEKQLIGTRSVRPLPKKASKVSETEMHSRE